MKIVGSNASEVERALLIEPRGVVGNRGVMLDALAAGCR